MQMNQMRPAGQVPLTYAGLADAFDRVLANHKFNETNHMYMTPGGADMMGMNMYGGMPNMMPGQPMQQFPVMPTPVPQDQTQSTIPQQVQSQNEVNVPVQAEEPKETAKAQEAEEVVHQIETPVETSAPYQSIPADATPEAPVEIPEPVEEPQPVVDQKKPMHSAWDDDHDDESDEEDSDEEEAHKEEDKEKDEVSPDQKETTALEEQEQQFYDNQPYDKRGGRGYGRGFHQRGGRGVHRGHRGHPNSAYRGRGRGYERGGRGYDRGGRGYDRGGRGRGNFEHERARGGRGRGRGNYYKNDGYYQDDGRKHYEAKEEKNVEDADGFMPVKEKVFKNKKKNKRGGNFKPKPVKKEE